MLESSKPQCTPLNTVEADADFSFCRSFLDKQGIHTVTGDGVYNTAGPWVPNNVREKSVDFKAAGTIPPFPMKFALGDFKD